MLCSEGGCARGRLLAPRVEDGGPRGGFWELLSDVISRGRGPPLAEGGTPFRSRPVVEARMGIFKEHWLLPSAVRIGSKEGTLEIEEPRGRLWKELSPPRKAFGGGAWRMNEFNK